MTLHRLNRVEMDRTFAALFGDALPEPRYCGVRRTALLTRTDDGAWTSPLQRIRDHNSRLWLRKQLYA